MDLCRLEKILDETSLNTITNLKILIVGVGGVGGMALEALVRFGVKNITIIDNDTINSSNLNRQIITNTNNIGNSKVKEAYLRAISINPNIDIKYIETFLEKANFDVLEDDYDYILDCCDTITTKVELISYSLNKGIKIITCTGTGNRFHPELLTITTINKTINDPLCKSMRRILKEHNLPSNIPCIWSRELPVKTHDRTPGSCSLVPNAAGLLMASYVINHTLNK